MGVKVLEKCWTNKRRHAGATTELCGCFKLLNQSQFATAVLQAWQPSRKSWSRFNTRVVRVFRCWKCVERTNGATLRILQSLRQSQTSIGTADYSRQYQFATRVFDQGTDTWSTAVEPLRMPAMEGWRAGVHASKVGSGWKQPQRLFSVGGKFVRRSGHLVTRE